MNTYYQRNREKILAKVQAYRKANTELIRSRARKKYAEDKKYREFQKEYQKSYRRNNKEKVNAYQRIYRNTTLKDWHNAWRREWSKTPKGKLKSSRQGNVRRALLGKSIGRHTVEEWNEILATHLHSCAHCGTKDKLTKDHIIPLSKGGMDTADNLQPLCRSCNASKGNRLIVKK